MSQSLSADHRRRSRTFAKARPPRSKKGLPSSNDVALQTAAVPQAPVQPTFTMVHRPRFSFIIPVYDRERFVYESISSALNQTYDDFEVLVVLDGSPPETRAVVDRCAKSSNVRVFSYDTPFGTACRARNRGIVEARGEYICLLDSDDIADPRRLEETDKVIAETDADVVYGAIRFIVDQGRDIAGIKFGDLALPNPNGFDLDDLIASNQIYTLSTTVRRQVLLDFGGFRPEMRYREDYELWLRLKFRGAKFAFTNKQLGLYRIHGNNNELTFKEDDAEWYRKSLELYSQPFGTFS